MNVRLGLFFENTNIIMIWVDKSQKCATVIIVSSKTDGNEYSMNTKTTHTTTPHIYFECICECIVYTTQLNCQCQQSRECVYILCIYIFMEWEEKSKSAVVSLPKKNSVLKSI